MNDENFLQRLLSQGISFAFRSARRLGGHVVKRLLLKLFAWLAAALAPFVIFILVGLLLFGFVYFGVAMLPKYITEGGGGAPGTMNVVVTAYTAGPESTGKNPGDPGYGITATGAVARRGTVAVDPEVIPFGTKMYIPGYGYGIAEDTGGAIKGNCIDVFMDDVDEALKWGRKEVNIKLFGKSPSNSPTILAWGKGDVGWPFSKDEKIFQRYLALDSGWMNQFIGYDELMAQKVDHTSGDAADENATVGDIWGKYDEVTGEKAQAKPHRVAWALMASMDKVLGDPIVHGEHGLEDGMGTKGRKPDPDKRFKELKPSLKWQWFELYYHHEWQVEVTGEDGGTSCETHSETYRHKIKLLNFADTYEADFNYTWKPKVIEKKSKSSGDCSYDYKRIVVPEVAGVAKQGPVYQRIRDILTDYGLYKDTNTELVLQLAMSLDEEFKVDASLFGSPGEIYMPDIEYTGEPGELDWPCRGTVTSRYGWRIHPITGKRSFHTGIDIAAPSGTPIHASGNGVVTFAGWNGAYGQCVIVNHGEYQTFYGHLKKIEAHVKQNVKGGDVIGQMGSTGLSTGPHLHFEIRRNGTTVNPEEVLGSVA